MSLALNKWAQKFEFYTSLFTIYFIIVMAYLVLGPNNPVHPNTVKVSVSVPHRDGLLPVISTTRMTNFDLTLSKDGFRLGQHSCSNLLNFDEVRTKYGFLTNATSSRKTVREVEPYQFSTELRTEPTLRFYR